MQLALKKIKYSDLNAKAQEMYNFQKFSSRLADYGFTCIWLSNDWQGADFIAVHIDGQTDIKVQLKSRLSFSQKYRGKNIYIAFIENYNYYLYPHDNLLDQLEQKISDRTWIDKGTWSSSHITESNRKILEKYKI